jgi:hypothetical protein
MFPWLPVFACLNTGVNWRQAMPHKLSLVVPGLCGPLPGFDGMEPSAAPLLELLKPLRKESAAGAGYAGLLAELFGLKIDKSFPYAALTLLAHDMEPGDSCWIHADPVNLQADMDRAILSDSQTLNIRQDEAEKLVNELNVHFAADDITVVMADENNWFIRLEDCDLETTPLSRAVARNINHLMPAGGAASGWRRLLNEAQMLLHISDVNQRREEKGLATVNSLWLWGEGVLPHQGSTDVTHVYTDDSVTTGLAKLDHIKHSALTDPIALACAMQHDGHSLVVINQLDGPCNYADTSAWLEEMLQVVEDWLNPLIETAKKSLDVDVNIYPCNGVRYHFSNNNKFNISKLMFWKKDRLQDHVDTQQGT